MSSLAMLLVQLVVILVTARGLGLLFRRLHQPQVVGEMAAGLVLGPSLLGRIAPDFFDAVFPAASVGLLSTLSQLGLLLFMFLIGLELHPDLLRGRGRATVWISWSSIVVPFGLGVGLALLLFPPRPASTANPVSFALFMGTAMSVTAFPVLARILTERHLLDTRIGSVAIACAAVDDVSAWTLLAAVVVISRTGEGQPPLWLTVLGSVAIVAIILVGLRPRLRGLEAAVLRRGQLTQDLLMLILLLALLAALSTELLGIHALFGAFLAGVALPKGQHFVRALTEKLEDVTVVLLLPLYFAVTGLRTNVGTLTDARAWAMCGLILVVAVAGKGVTGMLAARSTGLPWRDAGALGVMMNTRGLVELVVLNVGLESGVLSQMQFTMLVLMALATTCMTTPLLDVLLPATVDIPTDTAAAGMERAAVT